MTDKEIKAFLESEDGKCNAERFIKALKEGRIVCSVKHISKSGMSRVISFCEMQSYIVNRKKRWALYQFNWFFGQLGWTYDKSYDAIRVGGCGMDMIFATLYNVAGTLKFHGFKVPKDYCGLAAHYHRM